MKKIFLSILLSTLIIFSYSSTAYALPEDIEKVEFWAPPVMLKGQEYDVIVVLIGQSQGETRFNILSNNENIVSVIDKELIVEPFKSHGIAKVKAKSIGKVDLFAVSGEKLLTTSIEVVEPALMPARLDIILPYNKVSIKQIPAYVFLFDAFNNPLRAAEDIEVNISAFGNIKTQVTKTMIKQGMHYSAFIINIEGDGGVTVAANNLKSDTEMIEFGNVSDDIELKVEIAPDVLATSSSGELYVWLEKDDRPFVPEKDIKVVLSSEDSRYLAFSKAVQFSAPLDRDIVSTTEIFIKRGTSFAHTMVWTTNFLTNQGQDSKEITVTAAGEGVDSASATVQILKPVTREPNVAKTFALPDPAFDKLNIIVALYFSASLEAEDEENLCPEGFTFNPRTGECEEGEFEFTCPEGFTFNPRTGECEEGDEENNLTDLQPVIISDSVIVHVSTDSFLKPEFDRVRMGKDDLDKRDHYVVIPATTLGKIGVATITGTAGGTKSEQIEIKVEQRYSSIPEIAIKPLPTFANTEQDMFIVYALKEGTVVDSEIKDLVVKTKPTVQLENIINVNSIKVAKGRALDLVSSGAIEVTAIAPGFMGGVATVSVFNPELRHIVAYHPTTVHTTEPFPIVFYATDEKKHPIEIIEPSVSSTKDFVLVSRGMYMLSSGSEHNFVFYAEGVNPGTSNLNVFSHDITLDVSVNDKEFDLGDTIVLTYQVVPTGAKVTLDTDLPFQKNNNGFTIESTIPGSHTIVLTAERDGFNKTSKEVQIEIRTLVTPVTIEVGSNTNSEFDMIFSPNDLQSNTTILLVLVGMLVIIGGAIFYIFNKKKLKRSTDTVSEGDLTFLFIGGSVSCISI